MRLLPLLPLLLVLLAPLAALPVQGAAPGEGPVVRLRVDGAITRGTDVYLEESFQAAGQLGAAAIVLELDTPGGGLEETFSITDRIAASSIPVVGYVAPRTAHAWSAGTVILLSTHVAAMAPFTVIGSSQPVALGEGGFTPINDSKIVNALVGKLRALALAHGRNDTAAEEFVTKNLNLNADEALRARVIEHVAADVPALLAAIDGATVETAAGNVTLRTAGRDVRTLDPTLRASVLTVFFDPLITGLLMLVGIYALIFGLGAPGLGAEIAGGILILLALAGMGFNVSLVGILLLGLGAALLLLELHTAGFGAFGLAGLVALVLGTIFIAPLGPTSPQQWTFPASYQRDALILLATPSLFFAGFLAFALYKVQEARKRQPVFAGMEGKEAVVTAALGPGRDGFVRYEGEVWQARSEWEVPEGAQVVIRGKDGPVLRVEPLKSSAAPAERGA